MGKIPNFQKTKLRYGAHFAVMSAFDERVAPLCEQEPLLSTWYAAFKSALTHLDTAVKIARSSDYSKLIMKEDTKRDRLYSNGKMTAEMWSELGIEPQATAARAVLHEINIYKIDTKAQYDQQTGLMINFLQPFESAEMQTQLTTLGLTAVFTQMKAANEEVRRLLALRGNERAENAAYDLKSARQATDEAYENLVERINAIALINPSESWNTFIAQWSAEIARIKQQILSQTTQTGDDEGGTTPSGGDDGGNETPTGGGTDTGGGDTPPSGGDDNTGGGDPPPFSGTDQN
jgi:hypothetical protein